MTCSTANADVKYVIKLENGHSINIEAGFTEGFKRPAGRYLSEAENFIWNVGADYYFSDTTSAG